MQSSDPEYVDRLLDTALAHYGSAEPRPGLEGRILSNLQAEQDCAASRRQLWQRWTMGFAVPLVLVAVVWWGAVSGQPGRPREVPGSEQVHNPGEPFLGNQSKDKRVMHAAVPHKARSGPSVRAVHSEQVVAHDKMRRSQFPTLAPLSPEERLLARYVSEFPQDAARTAQAQAEMHKADELAWTTPPDGAIR